MARLLADGVGAQACLVYLEDANSRPVLRAASNGHGERVGLEILEPGKGVASQAHERREAIFSDGASSALPLLARSGRGFGILVLHGAPQRPSTKERAFLLEAASLVAGAIENAQA